MNRKLIASTTVAVLLALSACSSDDDDDTSPGEETSEQAPEVDSGDREIASEPSGDDTGAVAGLWDASSGEDARYVAISADGLYTDYDDQQDALGSGENCYVVTPRRLDLETGEALDGTYSASGLPSFALVDVEGTLTVTPFGADGGSGEPVVWERAGDGIAAESLTACDA